jgi:hypothetical protein
MPVYDDCYSAGMAERELNIGFSSGSAVSS